MWTLPMLFLIFQSTAFSQQIAIKKSHSITPSLQQSAVPTTGTLNVVAIMVEFQPDSNRLTSGTGIFGPGGLPYLENALDQRVEPLPHDKNYFEAHLEFAKNYFEKSSDGQLNISYQVLPQIYRLDKKMEEYSPTGETFTNEKIAYLIRDSWAKVNENGGFDATGLNPDETAFVIFHAGIGRDIELTGTTLDITPLDIPSIYLGTQGIGDLLDEPNFDGFEINNGAFRITNSLIIPRTESRRGLDIQANEFVFPLSINGLLCASIGSHLGLPDLFNTETGESGIGRFGLMDGASFFSYNGLFPPEPSAWEKTFLGWATPFEVTAPDSISLPAATLAAPNSIAKYEISSTEYFLIENRHRDINDSGVTLTFQKSDGSTVQKTFLNTNEQFVYQEADFDTLLEAGVLIDVDNFDWSLPGGFDIGPDEKSNTADDRYLNGGILIWHIDEAVIQNQLADGFINNNLERRGIVLKEADGALDIGKPIPNRSDNSPALGTPFDFWWSGNNYRVITQSNTITLYKNEFSPTSTPNNNSNSGATSYFRFYDFSPNLPTAYFKVEALTPENAPTTSHSIFINDNEFYSLTDAYSSAFPLALSKASSSDLETIVIPYSNGYYFFYPDSNTVTKVASGNIQQPLVGESIYIPRRISQSNQLTITPYLNESDIWVEKPDFVTPINNGLISSQQGDTVAVDGTTFGFVEQTAELLPNFRQSPVQESKRLSSGIASNLTNVIEFNTTGATTSDFSKTPNSYRSYVGNVELNNGIAGFFILEDSRLTLVNPGSESPFKTIFEGNDIDWPAIVDFDNDGELDFIFVDYSQNNITAVNNNGAILSGFPIVLNSSDKIIGTPLIADLDSDGQLDLVLTTQSNFDVNLRLYNHTSSEFDFSPLYVGGVSSPNSKAINPVIDGKQIIAISQTGELKSWEISALTNTVWESKYGNSNYNKVVGRITNTEPAPAKFTILNAEETYNWPNPADSETHLRFQLESPGGSVEVSIMSLSGKLVYKSTFQSSGGAPEEITLNTNNWASGGYYALVKATVNGKSESKLVKIAVVH